MPAEINGNHVIARFERARVYLRGPELYYSCGPVVLTPFFVFVAGHHNEDLDHGVVVSVAIPREDIYLIEDHSVEPCETHDEMDAEARALMETKTDAKKEAKD